MAISFACGGCGKKLKGPDHLGGKRIKCPTCEQPVRIPALEQLADSPDADDEFLASNWLNSDAAEDPQWRVERLAARAREAAAAESADDEFDQLATSEVAKPRKKKKSSSIDAVARPAVDNDAETFRYHWVFLIALIPLTLHIVWPEESVADRIERFLVSQPQLEAQVEQIDSLDEFVTLFPGGRLPGAVFPRQTLGHWGIGIFAASAYLALLFLMFPGSGKRTRRLLLTGLFTGTVGIFLLLVFQILAALPRGLRIGGRGLGVLIFLVLHLIGYSYRCASDPSIGFWGSFFGFTVGVGLCEELCKALPIWYYLTHATKTGWRGACLVGLASGIGFGVSEGIMYSGDMYNGIMGVQIYLVRFLSCVSLHAMWSGSVALLMYKNQDFLEFDDIGAFIIGTGYYLGAAMILHGLYDTLLKQELPYVALLIGFGSYFWLFKLVADSRGT